MVLNYILPMIVTIILTVIFVVLFTKKYKNADEKQKLFPVKIVFFVLIALEFLKIFYLISQDGGLKPNRYPIVFCSMVFLMYPLFCFKQNKFSTVAKSFSAIPAFIIFALFAATNTGLNLSIIQAHSYLFHGSMLAVGIYLFTSGLYKIEFKNFFALFAFMAGYVVFSTVLSLFIGGDISYFGPDSAYIGFIYDMFGYAAGNCLVIILLFLVTFSVYGIIHLCKRKGGQQNV